MTEAVFQRIVQRRKGCGSADLLHRARAAGLDAPLLHAAEVAMAIHTARQTR